MKRVKTVYEYVGLHGGGFKVVLIPRGKRPAGVDCIGLKFRSSKEAKRSPRACNWIAFKEWEALAVIEGLSAALLYKKQELRNKKR